MESFSPRDTAIMEEQFKNIVGNITASDSTASIRQTQFDNMAISYESKSSGNHLAVFSEVFYRDWKAYIDGKPAEYFKANYVLRAMIVPAGKHPIEFKFEPAVYFLGKYTSNISVWLLMLILAAYAVYAIRKKKQTLTPNF